MGLVKEFKEFVMRGNVLDMAIGVIIGGAFTNIVTSLNEDLIAPLLGIFGGTDFSHLTLTLGSGENAPVFKYGNFITAIINFLITALILFFILKAANTAMDKVKKPEEPAKPTTKICPYCKNEVPIDATRCGFCTSELK